jgi:hypothetical protein
LTTIRRAAALGLALGLGLGAPAMASSGHAWHHGSDQHSTAWGVDVAGEDGPAWGLTVTDHGPAWGVRVADDSAFSLPVVVDGDLLGQKGWDRGLSAFGIDDASITGDNPVADAYLGQPGSSNSLTGWTNDRGGWLGGLLGDNAWVAGGLF